MLSSQREAWLCKDCYRQFTGRKNPNKTTIRPEQTHKRQALIHHVQSSYSTIQHKFLSNTKKCDTCTLITNEFYKIT